MEARDGKYGLDAKGPTCRGVGSQKEMGFLGKILKQKPHPLDQVTKAGSK